MDILEFHPLNPKQRKVNRKPWKRLRCLEIQQFSLLRKYLYRFCHQQIKKNSPMLIWVCLKRVDSGYYQNVIEKPHPNCLPPWSFLVIFSETSHRLGRCLPRCLPQKSHCGCWNCGCFLRELVDDWSPVHWVYHGILADVTAIFRLTAILILIIF